MQNTHLNSETSVKTMTSEEISKSLKTNIGKQLFEFLTTPQSYTDATILSLVTKLKENYWQVIMPGAKIEDKKEPKESKESVRRKVRVKKKYSVTGNSVTTNALSSPSVEVFPTDYPQENKNPIESEVFAETNSSRDFIDNLQYNTEILYDFSITSLLFDRVNAHYKIFIVFFYHLFDFNYNDKSPIDDEEFQGGEKRKLGNVKKFFVNYELFFDLLEINSANNNQNSKIDNSSLKQKIKISAPDNKILSSLANRTSAKFLLELLFFSDFRAPLEQEEIAGISHKSTEEIEVFLRNNILKKPIFVFFQYFTNTYIPLDCRFIDLLKQTIEPQALILLSEKFPFESLRFNILNNYPGNLLYIGAFYNLLKTVFCADKEDKVISNSNLPAEANSTLNSEPVLVLESQQMLGPEPEEKKTPLQKPNHAQAPNQEEQKLIGEINAHLAKVREDIKGIYSFLIGSERWKHKEQALLFMLYLLGASDNRLSKEQAEYFKNISNRDKNNEIKVIKNTWSQAYAGFFSHTLDLAKRVQTHLMLQAGKK